MRSPSGCGDFRTDTRNLTCDKQVSIFGCRRPNHADRRELVLGELPTMEGPQRHTCIQYPIFFDNPNTEQPVYPPALGFHRERWSKIGEYSFLPPQRWMHNNEHGGAIFLYHSCLDKESLCALRRYIQKWQRRMGQTSWRDGKGDGFGDTHDKFRYVLTPFKNLATPIAIVMWGHVYTSLCYNEQDMDAFIMSRYRRAFEDWPPSGAYEYLWQGDVAQTAEAAGCAAEQPATPDHWTYARPEMAIEAAEKYATKVEASDKYATKELAKFAVGLSIASLVLVILLFLFVLLQSSMKASGNKGNSYPKADPSTASNAA